MEHRELRKFPNGESCAECPARRWYSESGFRYCQNGHRIEGFVEFDIDEDDNFGQVGKVSRREREAREIEARKLSGKAGRELFLECIQLLLRKQVAWLVRNRGLPAELEVVVRDLWDMRVRSFSGLRTVPSTAGLDDDGFGDWSSGSRSGTNSEAAPMYDSQTESNYSLTGTADSTVSRAYSWVSGPGEPWKHPRVIDTLALCYLGCLLLRLPIRVGDLFRWAKQDQLPYLSAADEISKDMRLRLPAHYCRLLVTRGVPFRGGELHVAVMDLVISYDFNFDMAFPVLNTPPLLLQYTRELALPAEVMVLGEQISSLLHLKFAFNTTKNKLRLLDHPDVAVAACVVLATKILYPFGEEGDSSLRGDAASAQKMDWCYWCSVFPETATDCAAAYEPGNLKTEEAWVASDQKLDNYLDWYQQSRIQETEGNERFKQLFPLSTIPPRSSMPELTEQAITERMRDVQSHMTIHSTQHTPGEVIDGFAKQVGSSYPHYQRVEDLPSTALAFYRKAAELSGLSTPKLVQAVVLLERKMANWIRRKRRKARIEDVEVSDGSSG